ncbi:MAG: primosomal protein N' (replication factor Y) [Candidatus Azotimanducaceae bacterium]
MKSGVVTDTVYLQIALPTPLRRAFSYLPAATEEIADDLLSMPLANAQQPSDPQPGTPQPGTRFYVPFGRQKLTGILLGTTTGAGVDPTKVRAVIRQIDDTPLLPPTLIALCQWAADYYHHPIGEVFSAALPRLLRDGEPLAATQRSLVLSDAAPTPLPELWRAPRQAALLSMLQTNALGITTTELKVAGFSASIIKQLIDRGIACWIQRPLFQAPFDHQRSLHDPAEIALNPAQQQAVEAMAAASVATWLLHGITGSGKTEVYFRAIAAVLQTGHQALVLVPEIGLTPQTVSRFTQRFSAPIVVLHSGLSDRERLDGFRAAKNGSAAIIIGTRSAIFTPLKNPGLIVIDEEHDASFKQQEGFRYSARDVAVMRGHLEGINVILGSATPSLESLQNAHSGKYRYLSLPDRAGGAQPAKYKIISTRDQILQDGFSAPLTKLIGEHLAADNQVLVFLNRRGFSPTLICQGCGWLAECRHCDARLTYHASFGRLMCHHCGAQQQVPRLCPSCKEAQLVPLGAGTQRAEQVLNKLFAPCPVIRIDRDTTRRKGAFNDIIEQLNKPGPAILVGTQLLAKGHHFPNVTLVAIVDMDAGFYSADFKATERMAQLLLQVGGRAGREHKLGTVALQTQFPEQPILLTLIQHGYLAFTQQLLVERSNNDLPPFHYHTLLRAESSHATEAMDFLGSLQQKLPQNMGVEILGPIPASMEKRAGRVRAQLLFSSASRRDLHYALDACLQLIEQAPPGRRLRWSVDVDPVDLF